MTVDVIHESTTLSQICVVALQKVYLSIYLFISIRHDPTFDIPLSIHLPPCGMILRMISDEWPPYPTVQSMHTSPAKCMYVYASLSGFIQLNCVNLSLYNNDCIYDCTVCM
jgi:hypothetical protein